MNEKHDRTKKRSWGMAHEPPLRELALFAGAGGGILAGTLLGWRTVCAVVLRDVAKHYPPARTQSENVRFCQEAALVLRRLGI